MNMRAFRNLEEALEGIGRLHVGVGDQRGILKSVTASKPEATVVLDGGGEITLPLRWLSVLEPGE